MNKYLIAVISSICLFSIILSGCEQINPPASNDSDKLTGSWQNTTAYPGIIHFYSNGMCIYGDDPGTWEISNNKLNIVIEEQGITHAYNYEFSNNDRKLLLTKTLGYSIVYTKQ